MYKEIVEDLSNLFTEPVKLPIEINNFPKDIMKFMVMKGYESDPSMYKKCIVSKDDMFIYVVYSDSGLDKLISYDILFWHGKKTALICVSDKVYDLDHTDLIEVMAAAAFFADVCLCHLVYPHDDILKDKSLRLVQYFAPMVLSCALAMTRYTIEEDDDLQKLATIITNLYNNGETYTKEQIDIIIKDIEAVGVDNLLDNSFIVGEMAFFSAKNKKEKEE